MGSRWNLNMVGLWEGDAIVCILERGENRELQSESQVPESSDLKIVATGKLRFDSTVGGRLGGATMYARRRGMKNVFTLAKATRALSGRSKFFGMCVGRRINNFLVWE